MCTSLGSFSPPLLNPDVIERRGIIEKLNAIPKQCILYMHAPAGYGKTTVTAQWLSKREAAWFSVDPYWGSAAGIYNGIISALSDGMAAAPPEMPLEAFLRSIQSIRSWPAALVIDDFHHCADRAVADALPMIRARMPSGVPLVILSRTPPPDALCGHIIKGAVKIVTELQFSAGEIIALFQKNGKFISTYAAEMLCRQTGGWAAALAAVLGSGVDGCSGMMSRETLNRYLRHNVLDPGLYHDFIKCAVCDVLHRDLCLLLTGNDVIWEVITRFSEKTGLIYTLRDGTYCFHALLKEFLEAELQKDGAIDKPRLYKAAAIWYKKNGDYLRAFGMAAKSGDIGAMDEIARILPKEPYGSAVNISEYAAFIEANLLSIPAAITERYPRLSIDCSAAAFLTRPLPEACFWFDVVENHMRKGLRRRDDDIGAAFILSLDVRHSSWHVPKLFKRVMRKTADGAGAPDIMTITFGFPFFHKAQRDYTDIAPALPEFLLEVTAHIEPVLGPLFKPLAVLLEAGIYYELGRFAEAEALTYELQKPARLPPEICFCAQALHTEIRRIQGKPVWPEKMGAMIERAGASYLTHNYSAFMTNIQLHAGDPAAAAAWLEQDGHEEAPRLHNVYRSFVTARALLAAGRFREAEILLERLALFSQDYRRNADYIEALALLSVCKWHTARANESVPLILPALARAAELHLMTPVIKLGGDILPILQKIKNRLKAGYDAGIPNKAFIYSLYRKTQMISHHTPGMFARGKPVRLSPRQMEVLEYLEQNYSYKEIAGIMGVKTTTIDDHIRKLYAKLDVSSSRELLRKARALGILRV